MANKMKHLIYEHARLSKIGIILPSNIPTNPPLPGRSVPYLSELCPFLIIKPPSLISLVLAYLDIIYPDNDLPELFLSLSLRQAR